MPIQEQPEIQQQPEINFERLPKNWEELKAYRLWKHTVAAPVRAIVEGMMKKKYIAGFTLKPEHYRVDLTEADEYLNALVAGLLNPSALPDDLPKRNLIQSMVAIGAGDGTINGLELLTSPDTSWQLRLSIYQSQIENILKHFIGEDLKKLQEIQAQSEKADDLETDVPPSDQNRSKASMSVEQSEQCEKPKITFRFKPPYGAKYKIKEYNKFDLATGEWVVDDERIFSEARHGLLDMSSLRVGRSMFAGEITPIALPNGFEPQAGSIKTDSGIKAKFVQDQNGNWYIKASANATGKVQFAIGRRLLRIKERFRASKCEGELPDEIKQKIAELKARQLKPMALARALALFVYENLTYTSYIKSGETNFDKQYLNHPQGFFGGLWAEKKADCHHANTLLAKILLEAGLSAIFVDGNLAREVNEEGETVLHSGNDHAWVMAWDPDSQTMEPLDATPQGDPNVNQNEQNRELNEPIEHEPDDPELATEEEIERALEEMKKQDIPPVDPEAERFKNFADQAKCSPEQAREFLEALARARDIKDGQGRSISKLWLDEWRKIIKERTEQRIDYRGPVSVDEGGVRLDYPVEAYIAQRTGDPKPRAYSRDETISKKRHDFGGVDVFFVLDCSDSMSKSDPVTSRRKIDVQRDNILLAVDALIQASYLSRRDAGGKLPVRVMVTLSIDDQDSVIALPLTDRWGPREQWLMYQAVARVASGSTPTHLPLTAIKNQITAIKNELDQRKVPKADQPLFAVLEFTDGVPNNFYAAETLHDELVADNVALASYTIGSDQPASRYGKPISSFSDAPRVFSEDMLGFLRKLYPKRVR